MGSAFKQRALGAVSKTSGQAPTGSINGSNTAFTTSSNYIAGSLEVYKNGIRLKSGASNDYTETGTNSFTMVTAPATGTQLLVDYLTASTNSGNADTLDGYNSSDFVLVSNGWTDWVPTFSGFSADPASGLYRYRKVGTTVELAIRQGNNGTSNAAGFTISLPFTAVTITGMFWVGVGVGVDNSLLMTTPVYLRVDSGGTVLNCYKDFASGGWTASGGKRLGLGSITYEAAA